MKVLLYHRQLSANQELSVTDRAAGRAHLLRKTIWWDIGLMLLLAVPGTMCYWYAPLLCRFPVLAWLVPVNSSPWEQLKPLFWITVLIALLRRICTGRLQKGLLTTYSEGLCTAMGGFIGGYYIISGIWGFILPMLVPFLFWLNAAYLVLSIRLNANTQRHSSLPGAIVLLLLAGCFIWFTGHPPAIGLFMV